MPDIPQKELLLKAFYEIVLKEKHRVVAPMVDQSALAWRVLGRRYGATLCYTPMLHSRLFSESAQYRSEQFSTNEGDRPLVVQFCANDPATLLKAAQMVEDECDAIDINLGCPQHIAKRGRYGAFLMDDWPLVASLVKILSENLKVPVTCKIRIFPDVEKSIAYAKMLQDAGCKLLTVHGRLREQKGHNTGLADWEQIRRIKEVLTIPVFANGNLLYFEDIQQCLDATGCDGVMSAEGQLYNPAIFNNTYVLTWDMAQEYLDICQEVKTSASMIRAHLFKIFKPLINDHPDQRDLLVKAQSLDEFLAIVAEIKKRVEPEALALPFDPTTMVKNEKGLYDIPKWYCQPYIRPEDSNVPKRKAEATEQDEQVKETKPAPSKKQKSNILVCTLCPNVASANCDHKLCKNCCFKMKKEQNQICVFHAPKPKEQPLVSVEEVTVEAN